MENGVKQQTELPVTMPPAMYVFLPPSLYDRAAAEGYDMRWYVKQQLIPRDGNG